MARPNPEDYDAIEALVNKIGPEGVLDALRYTLIFKAENENGDERAKVFERAAASLARYTETFVSNFR